jgi:Amt family ammonium transporter
MGGGMAQLGPQLIGIVSIAAFVFVVSVIAWVVIKAVYGLRVSAEEEREGLDTGEHGNVAYPDFQPATVSQVVV